MTWSWFAQAGMESNLRNKAVCGMIFLIKSWTCTIARIAASDGRRSAQPFVEANFMQGIDKFVKN